MESRELIVSEMPSIQLASMEDMKNQIKAVETCIKEIMVQSRHYGTIPGCGDKKCLLKPGAELLAKLFQIRPEFTRQRIDLGSGHFQIIADCKMISHTSGRIVGEGSGNCSTMESKFRWRKAGLSCPKCNGSIRRSKYPPREDKTAPPGWYCAECNAQYCYGDVEIRGQKTGRVDNPDIADTYNTVQKIADKRAYVAAVITTTGASDYVTQDIADPDDELPRNGQDHSEEPQGGPEDTTPQTAKARADLIKQAEEIIGQSGEAVSQWAFDKNKIKKGQTWREMELPDINTIIKSGKGFVVMVNNHIDAKGK